MPVEYARNPFQKPSEKYRIKQEAIHRTLENAHE